ncbi:hypothetical protein D3C85_555740 [compost metagenome]
MKRFGSRNFCTITTVDTMYLFIGCQYLLDNMPGSIEHGIANDEATEVSFPWSFTRAIHHITQDLGIFLIIIIRTEFGMMMALIPVAIIQTK